MKNLKINWKRIIPIIIICAIIDAITHLLFIPTYEYGLPPSYFVKTGLFQPAIMILLLISYILLAVVFVSIQEKLSGSKLSKGFLFGALFGGLWFIGIAGTGVTAGSPFFYDLLSGFFDAVALIILGTLLGLFVATDNINNANKVVSKKFTEYIFPTHIFPAVIIALFFILGQYIAFILVGKATPLLNILGAGAFIWTLMLGLWIGIMYGFLKNTIKGDSLFKRAFWFGGIILGINWFLFNIFTLVFVTIPIYNPLTVAVFNILSVIAGVFVVEKLTNKDKTMLSC